MMVVMMIIDNSGIFELILGQSCLVWVDSGSTQLQPWRQ